MMAAEALTRRFDSYTFFGPIQPSKMHIQPILPRFMILLQYLLIFFLRQLAASIRFTNQLIVGEVIHLFLFFL